MATTITATKSYGTILAYTDVGAETIGSLNNIGGLEQTANVLDATNHDNADGYKQFIQGIRDAGECSVEGQLYAGDAGQNAVIAHFAQDTTGGVRAMAMSFPDGSSWAFDAIVSKLKTGDAPVDGLLPFTATFKVTGSPTWTPGGS
jgi:predicted secreted protein